MNKSTKSTQFLRPGQRAMEAGFYEEIGPRGGHTGIKRVMRQGAKFPPTQYHGEGYRKLDLGAPIHEQERSNI